LAGAAMLCTALTGCSSHHIPADPAQALRGSLAGIEAGRYSFDVTFPYAHLTGSIDKAGHQAHWTDTMDNQPGRIVTQDLVIGHDMYVTESGGGGTPGYETPVTVRDWRHLDLSREHDGEDPMSQPDVNRLRALIPAMTANAVDGDTIHGSLDLSAMAETSPDLWMVTAWADAGPLPATAKLDDQGRLVELTADLPAEGKLKPAGWLIVKLSDYGAAVAPAPRPTEAPGDGLSVKLNSMASTRSTDGSQT
jgi:hypothetical protein